MLNRVVMVLLVVTAAAGMAILAGCDRDKAPEITAFTATPADSVVVEGTSVTFRAVGWDEEGDKLSFEWLASDGDLSETGADTTVWTAPAAGVTSRITLRVSDGKKTTDTSKVISSRGWYEGSADAYTEDSVPLPNNATTEIPFTWDQGDTLMPGAIVDSVEITLGFYYPDPDTLALEDFTLTLISPQGTPVLLYDGINLTDLDLSLSDVYGFENEPVDGLWRLVFTRNNPSGRNALLSDCELDIDYKY